MKRLDHQFAKGTAQSSLSSEMIESILNNNRKLEDEHMIKFSALMEEKTGFKMQSTLLYQVPDEITAIQPNDKHIQILFTYRKSSDEVGNDFDRDYNTQEGHWICSYYDNNVIRIYDSINKQSLEEVASVYLKELFPFDPKIEFHNVQEQTNSVDCGLYAVAFAVSLSLGKDPSTIFYDQSKLRSHVYEMLVNNTYEHFPCTQHYISKRFIEESFLNRKQRLQNHNKLKNKSNISADQIKLVKTTNLNHGYSAREKTETQKLHIVTETIVIAQSTNHCKTSNQTSAHPITLVDGVSSNDTSSTNDFILTKCRKKRTNQQCQEITDVENKEGSLLTNKRKSKTEAEKYISRYAILDLDNSSNDDNICHSKHRREDSQVRRRRLQNINKLKNKATRSLEKINLDRTNDKKRKYNACKKVQFKKAEVNIEQNLNSRDSNPSQISNQTSAIQNQLVDKAINNDTPSSVDDYILPKQCTKRSKRQYNETIVSDNKENNSSTNKRKSKNEAKKRISACTILDLDNSSNDDNIYHSKHIREDSQVRRRRLQNINKLKNKAKRSMEQINLDRINDKKRKYARRKVQFKNANVTTERNVNTQDNHQSQISNHTSAISDQLVDTIKNNTTPVSIDENTLPKRLQKRTERSYPKKIVSKSNIENNSTIIYNNSDTSPGGTLIFPYEISDLETCSDEDSIISDTCDSIDDNFIHTNIKKKKNKTKNYFMVGVTDTNAINEKSIDQHYIGKMDVVCELCKSLNFNEEKPPDKKFSKCCHKGKVILPEFENYPVLLKDLLTGKSTHSRHFKENIRSYNSALAFASMGTKIDKPPGKGPFVFRIHGQIYHNTFALHPNENEERKYGQLYILDSKQANDERLKRACNSKCNDALLKDLDKLIREINPYAKAYNMMSDIEKLEKSRAVQERREVKPIYMWIKQDSRLDKNRFNSPTCDEVAVVFTGEDGEPPINRDICIHPKADQAISISNLSPNLDPMTYPLLFPNGETGWTTCLKQCYGNRDITPLQYYSYRLAWRGHFNQCLSAGPLTQQYIVDVWCKIEGERLKYIRKEQKRLRSDLYSGLMDYLQRKDKDKNITSPGKMVILPSTFQTSPRAYQQLYMDAMCLVQKHGKPQLFITMTCNPKWPEIIENLNPGESPSDRPDLVARVFQLKVNQLKRLLFQLNIFGKHSAYIYVIEFQKRGLPHIHLLIFFQKEYTIREPATVDKIISAEIPDRQKNPRLYETVKQFMVHGPCGKDNINSPCMDPHKIKCTKNFPKKFSEETIFNNDSYPIYRRRNNERVICYSNNKVADNKFIVPYNPFLLLNLNCHCNVEVCSTVQWIKYLFKYCYKGHDCAMIEIKNGNNSTEYKYDEISNYLSTRYVCPPEAMHRIFQFKMHEQSHATVRLAVHLEGQEMIYFHEGSEVKAIEERKNTTLTAWFELNQRDENAKQYLYVEISDHYVFDPFKKTWKKRSKQNKPVISRMYFVNPTDIERYNLRLLLLHVRGALNFKDLRTYKGIVYETFTEAAKQQNLIENDNEIEKCLDEATNFQFPNESCRLFGYICVFCYPQNGNFLWQKYKKFFLIPKISTNVAEQIALRNIEEILVNHGYSLGQFGLPSVDEKIILSYYTNDNDNSAEKNNIEELKKEVLLLKITFNHEQAQVFNSVINAVNNNSISERYFYLDGPGGSGKSYLLNAIIKMMESEKKCVLSVAWTGIAANLLLKGKTVHTMFKLPMLLNETSTCNVSGVSKHADVIRKSELIIWDEVTMSPKYALQAVDLLCQDLMKNNTPFGGKVVLLSGDWRQILPVVKHGSRTRIVEECIKSSYLWKYFKHLSLKINQRVSESQKDFMNWLLQVGNGDTKNEFEKENDIIEIPNEFLTKNNIIREVYGKSIKKDDTKVYNYAILAPINLDVLDINNEIIKKLEGDEKQYLSIDVNVSDSKELQNIVPIEYMNSITPSGFPPHKLVLKKGAIVMLLRNLNTSEGLCNGTRLVIIDLMDNLLVTKIISGKLQGEYVLLPRIKLITSDDELPFKMLRKQFPIRLAYAMTINKAQGQTFDTVGVYLKNSVFSHGQLYVALSRVRSKENLKISIIEQAKFTCNVNKKENRVYIKNIVYKEILNR